MKYGSYPDPEQCFNIEAYGKFLKEHLSPRLGIRLTSNLVCSFLILRPTNFCGNFVDPDLNQDSRIVYHFA